MALPNRALTDEDLRRAARRLRIPHFRGVFLRDTLPRKVHQQERGIVNLDDSKGPGTHWVAYIKNDAQVKYFDSYGNLRPPKELTSYLCTSPGTRIQYNTKRYQRPNTWNCGHLALEFLYKYPKMPFKKRSRRTRRRRPLGIGLVRHKGQKKRRSGAGIKRRPRGGLLGLLNLAYNLHKKIMASKKGPGPAGLFV